MRYLIITMLFIKRLIKKTAFVCMLAIMPVMVLIVNVVNTQNDKSILVGVYNDNDELSKKICEDLNNKKGYIKFLVYDNKNEMTESVENKKLECAYVFPSDLKNKLDNYETKSCVTCIESPSTILSSLCDEVVFAEIFHEYGRDIAVDFAKENNIFIKDNTTSSENVSKNYDKFNTPEKTFSINYKSIDTNENSQGKNNNDTICYVIHGIISVLILICGLLGVVTWFKDEKNGLYSSFNNKSKTIIGFICILAPTFLMGVSGITTIFISQTYTNVIRELLSMVLYILLVCGISYLFKLIMKCGTDICAILPAITIGSLIFCPVFIDVSKFLSFTSWINKLFPTFYYLNSISKGTSGLVLMAIISFLLLFITITVNLIKEK